MSLDVIFEHIADDLGIRKGNTEDRLSWKFRIVYSVAAKRGLDTLWEKENGGEQNGTVSLSSITRTIDQVFKSFHALCPDLEVAVQDFMQCNLKAGEGVAEYLSTLLQKGGCFYHCPYRAAPVIFSKAQLGGMMFLRGLPSGAERCMSGAGMYAEASAGEQPKDVAHIFGLHKILSGEDLDSMENSLPVQCREHMDGWEFLDLSPSYKKYWKNNPDKGVLSLVRKRRETEKIYMLYRYDGRKFFCRTLPEYWNSATRYLALAVAFLSQRGTLPPITAEDDGPMVSLKIGYRLPPAEETFFRLYSWPDIVRKKNPYFFRIMARPVFEAFKILMPQLGYTLLEESHA